MQTNKLIKQNIINKDIVVIKSDYLSVEWINLALNKNYKFEYAIRIVDSIQNDTSYVREYYNKDMYFKGKIVKNNRYSTWGGYYKEIKIISPSYLGFDGIPIYVDIKNRKNGKIVRHQFSIIE
jgi:hypothetical protein